MSRRCDLALKVERASSVIGKPSHTTILKAGVALVYQGFEERGRAGYTTKDWPGYDLRHYIREMKNRGIEIDCRWEKNGFGGQHKRWWLKDGHSSLKIPYPKKKTARRRSERLSNPASQDGNLGGLSDAA